MKRFLDLILCLSIISYCFTQDVVFERTPYLQKVSKTSAIIRFRTKIPVISEIKYGIDKNLLNFSVGQNELLSEHRIELTNLLPNTKYYYQVVSLGTPLTDNDGSYFVETNPDQTKNTRIWVIGDTGRGNSNAFDVKQSYLNQISKDNKKADLFLMLGDNAYNNGLDNEYNSGLFNVYHDIIKNTVLWPTIGNHDGYAKFLVSGEIPYYQSFSLPRNGEVGGIPSETESYYSFNYSNIHFICLNSYDENRDSNAKMAQWLKQDLSADRSKWKVAYWHHPPYSKGSHDSDTEVELVEMREQILPILEDFGVDLVLAGHSHSYERSFLISGHYGTSENFSNSMLLGDNTNIYFKPPQNTGNYGSLYVVNGTSAVTSYGALNHPVMYTSQSKLASMIIDVNAEALTSKTINNLGEEIDTFTIYKKNLILKADSSKVLSGKVLGKLQNINLANSNYQKLIAVKKRGETKSRIEVNYKFKIPKHFYKTSVALKINKLRKADQNFLVSYSLDGKKFRRLKYLTASYNGIIPILNGYSGNLYLKISNIPSRKKSGILNLDQLVITNS